MPRLLHISDLHLGKPFLTKAGKALCSIAPNLNADAIIVSGDITQRAKRDEFEEARYFLENLPSIPRLVIPGNHDVPLYRVVERLGRPHYLYQKYICEALNPVLQLDGALIVGLDSTFPRGAIANGRLFGKQLDFCRDIFGMSNPADIRIIVAHHHFAQAPDYRRHRIMSKSSRAMECFVDLGVEVILGGHLHRSYIGNSLDFFQGNSRDKGIIIVQCGTTTSSRGIGRESGKNTFNVVDIGAEGVNIAHYLYDDADGRFHPISQHLFPRPGKMLHSSLASHAPVESAVQESGRQLR